MNASSTPTVTHPQTNTRTLVRIALVTAVTCILAPLSIPLPFSPVPLSLTNFVLYVSIFLLGWKSATISYLVYLLLGTVGLPVFSGFAGGLGKLAGPTGGYLVGMIFLTILSGFIAERCSRKPVIIFLGMLLGSAVNYLFGTLWLCMQLHLSFLEGLMTGVVPYIVFDIIKMVIALIIGITVQKRLKHLL
jgi:biotin transport system substrate-specific component|nr:biotin transporter BioY [uncultured Faecalimonas sp.]